MNSPKKALAAALFTGALATGAITTASATNPAVTTNGTCTGKAKSTLTLGEGAQGRISTKFMVDQDKNWRVWQVLIARNDRAVRRQVAITRPSGGSFTVHYSLANAAGPERVVASAINPLTGEVCVAIGTWTA